MSERYERGFSNRSLLADASVDDMQNILEKDLLIKYQDILNKICLNQVKLHDTHELLRGIHAGDSGVFSDIKNELQEQASNIASELNQLDRQLIELERNQSLQNIIEREKVKAEEQIRKEVLERYKEKAAETERELMARYQESRQKALQRREQVQQQQKQESISEVHKEEPKRETKVDKSNKIIKSTLKENLAETLGTFGIILYFVSSWIIYILPFVMIGGNFFLTLLLIAVNAFVPFASAIFWIWGLVCAIKGVQDIWAIIYYIVFVVVWIPFYISTITSFSKKDY
jgi:flagellar biosynthesis GTPase FlhF